jgi:hypothetical protein
MRAVLPPLDKPIPLERPQHVADGERGLVEESAMRWTSPYTA